MHSISILSRFIGVGVVNHEITFTPVLEHDTLAVDFIDRSGGAVINSISDTGGGSWVNRAEEQTFSTFLLRRYVSEDRPAAASITVTIVTNVSQNSQVLGAFLRTDTGGVTYVTFDNVGATANVGAGVDSDSGSVVLSVNNGSTLGLIATSAAQASTPTLDSGGTIGPATEGGARSFYAFSPEATAGSYLHETTLSTSSASRWIITSFKDSAPSNPPPVITDVDEDNTVTSSQAGVEIDGTDFDSASVEIEQADGPLAQIVTGQTATAITFDVEFDSGAGPHLKYGSATLTVINTDAQQDTQAITIDPPSGVDFVDAVAPLAAAGLRITGIPDLAGDDQIEYYGVVGGDITDITVFANLSWAYNPGVTGFWARAWDASDATWGDPAFQSIGAPGGTGGIGGSSLGSSNLSIGSGLGGSGLSLDNMLEE